jgi:hypothetical protein
VTAGSTQWTSSTLASGSRAGIMTPSTPPKCHDSSHINTARSSHMRQMADQHRANPLWAVALTSGGHGPTTHINHYVRLRRSQVHVGGPPRSAARRAFSMTLCVTECDVGNRSRPRPASAASVSDPLQMAAGRVVVAPRLAGDPVLDQARCMRQMRLSSCRSAGLPA